MKREQYRSFFCRVGGRAATKITEFNNGPVTSLLIKPDSVATDYPYR